MICFQMSTGSGGSGGSVISVRAHRLALAAVPFARVCGPVQIRAPSPRSHRYNMAFSLVATTKEKVWFYDKRKRSSKKLNTSLAKVGPHGNPVGGGAPPPVMA